MIAIVMAAAVGACVMPPGFEGWSTRVPATGLAVPGRATMMTLAPGGRTKEGAPGFAGEVPLRIAAAGRYRIGLDTRGWIDVVRDGRTLPSAAHAHGSPCGGPAKIVSYDLRPGAQTLRVSASPAAAVRVMVVLERPPSKP